MRLLFGIVFDEDLKASQRSGGFAIEINILGKDAADDMNENVRFGIVELNPNVRSLINISTIAFPSEKNFSESSGIGSFLLVRKPFRLQCATLIISTIFRTIGDRSNTIRISRILKNQSMER